MLRVLEASINVVEEAWMQTSLFDASATCEDVRVSTYVKVYNVLNGQDPRRRG